MIKVGITGGIGSGKSTFCTLLNERGAALYVADEHAKRLMAESSELRRAICEAFGDEAYKDGVLNRQYLAERVFKCKEQLERLNSIVHPAVLADFRAWAQQQKTPYVLFESAILFSAGFESEMDFTLAVLSPEPIRIERASIRDGVSQKAVRLRMRNQMSDDEFRDRADYSVVNISLDDLRLSAALFDRVFRYEASHR